MDIVKPSKSKDIFLFKFMNGENYKKEIWIIKKHCLHSNSLALKTKVETLMQGLVYFFLGKRVDLSSFFTLFPSNYKKFQRLKSYQQGVEHQFFSHNHVLYISAPDLPFCGDHNVSSKCSFPSSLSILFFCYCFFNPKTYFFQFSPF
jgi:hypothetical protein